MKKKMTPVWRDKSRSKASNPKDADLLSARSQFGSAVDQLALQKKWDEIINLLRPLLKQHENEHWIHLQLATAYFEKFDDYNSTEYLWKATRLHGFCPFNIWLWARTAFRDKVYEAVFSGCHDILERGLADILVDTCCKNQAAAESLMNDCHYLLAKTYKLQKKHDLAKEEMEKFKEGLRSGIKSIYRKKVPARVK
jgi:tetratricopeptide (TPR) repeat protein